MMNKTILKSTLAALCLLGHVAGAGEDNPNFAYTPGAASSGVAAPTQSGPVYTAIPANMFKFEQTGRYGLYGVRLVNEGQDIEANCAGMAAPVDLFWSAHIPNFLVGSQSEFTGIFTFTLDPTNFSHLQQIVLDNPNSKTALLRTICNSALEDLPKCGWSIKHDELDEILRLGADVCEISTKGGLTELYGPRIEYIGRIGQSEEFFWGLELSTSTLVEIGFNQVMRNSVQITVPIVKQPILPARPIQPVVVTEDHVNQECCAIS